MLVASYSTGAVYRYDSDTGAQLGTFIPAGSGGMAKPTHMTIGPNGDVYVIPYSYQNPSQNRVYQFRGNTGSFVRSITTASLVNPEGLAFGPDGMLYVSSADSGQILRFNPSDGGFLGVFATTPMPIELAFGPDQNLYVAGAAGGGITRINGTTGAVMATFGSGNLNNAFALTFGPEGLLYVQSQYDYKIQKFDALSGTFLGTFYAGAYPYNPSSGMVWGPDGKLYTGNLANGSAHDGVWRFNANGAFDGYLFDASGNFNATGIAFVPEPAGSAVVAIASAVILLRRRVPRKGSA